MNKTRRRLALLALTLALSAPGHTASTQEKTDYDRGVATLGDRRVVAMLHAYASYSSAALDLVVEPKLQSEETCDLSWRFSNVIAAPMVNLTREFKAVYGARYPTLVSEMERADSAVINLLRHCGDEAAQLEDSRTLQRYADSIKRKMLGSR